VTAYFMPFVGVRANAGRFAMTTDSYGFHTPVTAVGLDYGGENVYRTSAVRVPGGVRPLLGPGSRPAAVRSGCAGPRTAVRRLPHSRAGCCRSPSTATSRRRSGSSGRRICCIAWCRPPLRWMGGAPSRPSSHRGRSGRGGGHRGVSGRCGSGRTPALPPVVSPGPMSGVVTTVRPGTGGGTHGPGARRRGPRTGRVAPIPGRGARARSCRSTSYALVVIVTGNPPLRSSGNTADSRNPVSTRPTDVRK
jgi:hypothetical protein